MKATMLRATRLLGDLFRWLLPKQRYRPELHYMRGKPSGSAPLRSPKGDAAVRKPGNDVA